MHGSIKALVSVIWMLPASIASSAILFEDNFDAYADGQLAGQGGWVAELAGTGVATVTGGKVRSNLNAASSVASPSFGVTSNAFYGIDVQFTSFPNSGSYNPFVSFRQGAANTRGLASIRDNWNSNTQFTLVNNAGARINKDLSQTYRLVVQVEQNVAARYWIGTDPLALDPLAPYYVGGANTGSYDKFVFLNTSLIGATYDNLVVATTFTEAAGRPIPEPATVGLLAMGALALGRRR